MRRRTRSLKRPALHLSRTPYVPPAGRKFLRRIPAARRWNSCTVQVDAHIHYATLREVPGLVQSAERLGIDGVWFSETEHDPFLGAALAAEHSHRLTVGTSVAIAFTRSPTLLAYLAWDLAALCGGRFVLGLGTQVKAHVVRRFGMPWDPPAPKLKDTVAAIRAVWQAWRTRGPLDFHGRFYTLSLMTPFFTPPPHEAAIPIVTAGVNPAMCRAAGAVADGFVVHPFHTAAYLQEVIRPAIQGGRASGGRADAPFTIQTSVFTVCGDTDADLTRARGETKRAIAFYASTPSYRGVLAHHGWEEVGKRLSAHAARGAWDAMADEVSDEMLSAVAVIGRTAEIGQQIVQRYRGLVDRIGLYEPFSPAAERKWRSLLNAR